MLSEEQIKQIKKQLLQQIENFPEDKKEIAKQQIEEMDSEQLEEFLEQNNLVQKSENKQQCVFCSIAEGKIPSSKIEENEEAIAILEINPVSRGHVLVIPKNHNNKISKTITSLAEKISKKIKAKLKPAEVKIAKSELFGHQVLNVIPVYKNENLNSPRQKAKPEELEKIKSQLEEKPKKPKPIKKVKPEKIDENIRLPKRIP